MLSRLTCANRININKLVSSCRFDTRRYSSNLVNSDDKVWRAAEYAIQQQQQLQDHETSGISSSTPLANVLSRGNIEKIKHYMDEAKELEQLKKRLQEMAKTESDKEMQELALADVNDTEAQIDGVREKLIETLVPRDPTWDYGATIEVQMGVGGQESGLFAGQLARMYLRWTERRGWKPKVTSFQDLLVQTAEENGQAAVALGKACKEAILEVNAPGAYGALRHEGGVHRVQRIPQTENSDRIHTSTVSVTVFPIAPENARQKLALYEPKDLKIEVMRSSGAGGQHVNRTESCVRVTHLPTGISVRMQESRSQHENRAKAIQTLEGRLLQLRLEEERADLMKLRSSQVGSVARSDKQRTYNYPQDRMTDHRLGESVYNLQNVMDGGPILDEFSEMLSDQDNDSRVDAYLEQLQKQANPPGTGKNKKK